MKKRIWLLRLITFLSSFLLFQIEFIVGKIFLANFGGGFMVWGACLVFFQAILLLGYFYAHHMSEKFGISKYLIPHGILLLTPVVFFPGRLLSMTYHSLGLAMVADVFIHLFLTIGPVFFLLSTMSIITQAWLASSSLPERDHPYALFAVSNFGSLLALISYPFIFEMFLDLRQQQDIWRVLYAAMVVLYAVSIKVIRMERPVAYVSSEQSRVGKVLAWQWFLYGAAGVTIFLAVTNVLTAEIAPMPLLWMLPLVIYLLSYILNFKARPWCPRWMEKSLPIGAGFGTVLYFMTMRQIAPTMMDMVFMLVFTFVICMFCQRRLYVLRPGPENLTFFYFMMSLGGFAGGAITTWVIPLIFVNYAEYFLGLVFVLAAWFLEERKACPQSRVMTYVLIIAMAAAVYWGPIFLKEGGYFGLLCWISFIVLGFHIFRKNRVAAVAVLVLFFLLLDVLEPRWLHKTYIYGKRNYYGKILVTQESDLRLLFHGTTLHGTQYMNPEKSHIPLSYYHPKSPPAQILINERDYKHIGLVGLGTGSLVMYGRPYQQMDFYELDPDVLWVSMEYFSYLRQAHVPVRHIIQDARVGLEKNSGARYDILIVDAFSGNSVPVHLLTKECLDLYRRRSTPGGIILFHLANRYVNLTKAFIRTAAFTDAYILYKQDNHTFSDWAAVTYDVETYHRLVDVYKWKSINKEKNRISRPWTDGYSNILPFFFLKEVSATLLEKWDVK